LYDSLTCKLLYSNANARTELLAEDIFNNSLFFKFQMVKLNDFSIFFFCL
jgi:hypothetical protein